MIDAVLRTVREAGQALGVWTLLGIFLVAIAGLLLIGRVPLRYNFRNLSIRWRTTLLTSLAFTLVIALLTVMLAFVNGMQRMTESTGHPANVLVLADGSTDEAFSTLSPGDVLEIENLQGIGVPPIVEEHGRRLASRETYMIVNQPVPDAPRGRPRRRFVQLRGCDDPWLTGRVHDIGLMAGDWFSYAGVREMPQAADETAIEAVLGLGAALELGRDRSPEEIRSARNPQRLDIGDTFQLAERTWVVTGILDSETSTFNSEIWAKRSLVGQIFGKNTYTTLVIRLASAADAMRFKTYLLEEYRGTAVAPQLETDYYENLSETSKQFLYAIGFIAVVMSVGGIFGVMNTMFAAISQRVKDVGVLRLLGYARWQILVSFLLESLAIALVGGLLGCALGSLCDGWTVTSVVSGGPGGGKSVVLRLIVDADIWATGLLLTLVMGLAGGLLPSINAMRLRALEALR